MGVYRYVSFSNGVPFNLTTGNYDVNELWYEYEEKKKAARAAAPPAAPSPMAVEA